MRGAFVGFAMAVVGCSGSASFLCSDDDQCGGQGRCEASGFCSFPDPSCESGRRYAEYAAKLASTCVPDDEASSPTTTGDDGWPSQDDAAGTDDSDGSMQSGEAEGESDSNPDESESESEGGATDDGMLPTTGEDGCQPVIVDDFEAGIIDDRWEIFGQDQIAIEAADGELQFGLPSVADQFGGVTSIEALDLREGYASIELGDLAILDGQEGIFVVRTGDGAEVRLRVQDGVLNRSVEGPGVSATSAGPFDLRAQRHLRIRFEPEAVVLETSPDGQTFDAIDTTPTGFDASNSTILLIAGTWMPAEAEGSFAVRRVDACLASP